MPAGPSICWLRSAFLWVPPASDNVEGWVPDERAQLTVNLADGEQVPVVELGEHVMTAMVERGQPKRRQGQRRHEMRKATLGFGRRVSGEQEDRFRVEAIKKERGGQAADGLVRAGSGASEGLTGRLDLTLGLLGRV